MLLELPVLTNTLATVMLVTDTSYMFYQATSLNQDLCSWYNMIQGAATVNGIFSGSGCDSNANPNFSSPSSFWLTTSVKVTNSIQSNLHNHGYDAMLPFRNTTNSLAF